MARRLRPSHDDAKTLRRSILEILLGGGLFAAAVPVAQNYFKTDDACDVAYRAIDAIKPAGDLPRERQLLRAEKWDRAAER